MGLGIYIKGLDYKDSFHSSYSGFTFYRQKIANAYNPRLGELYDIARIKFLNNEDLSVEEIEEWNKICNDDLDIFLWHSDCDGKLTVKECRKVYKILKEYDYNLFPFPFNDLHKKFLSNLKFCIDNRRNMYFC